MSPEPMAAAAWRQYARQVQTRPGEGYTPIAPSALLRAKEKDKQRNAQKSKDKALAQHVTQIFVAENPPEFSHLYFYYLDKNLIQSRHGDSNCSIITFCNTAPVRFLGRRTALTSSGSLHSQQHSRIYGQAFRQGSIPSPPTRVRQTGAGFVRLPV